MPSASAVFAALVSRLQADLRAIFPAVEVRIRPTREAVVADWLVCEVLDEGLQWGEVTLVPDATDDLSLLDAERLIATVVEEVVDNLWPDELTDPWPRCPIHGDHPLQPGVVRGEASWKCLREDGPVVRIGNLASQH